MNRLFITGNIISDALDPLINFFGAMLVAIHGLIGSWGWSIIAMTFLIRAALIPLTLKQIRSMQAMQKHQPEIKAIQTKYKGQSGETPQVKAEKRQKMNEEMMAFYRENKINPLASCLPLLAQMPVFISLFYLLQNQLKTDICPSITEYAASVNKTVEQVSCGQVPGSTGQEFLFIPDLTSKASGAVLITLLVLYVGTQLGSSLMMTTTMDKTQRNIMLAMPLVFVFFIINFPAGLILYWITTNTWTVGQQAVVKRLSGPPVAVKDDAGADKPSKSNVSEAKADPAKGKGGPPPKKSNKKRTGRRK
jgi:YidC/Oxa1 family membrane protein insertase